MPSQLTAVRFVIASGRDNVALRPGEDGEPVSPSDITYDDYGRLYVKTYDSHNQLQDKLQWRALEDGDEVSAEDIRAGNLVFIPAADFDRTAEFTIQVWDGETWSNSVRLFIQVVPSDDGPEFYSRATPPDAQTGTDQDGREKTLFRADTQPLEVVAQDGAPNLFAYQALADGPDTDDSFAEITYALKGGLGDDVLIGGAGDDTLNGVDEDNTLYGDGGADRFVLNRKASGTTTVKDFADGIDKIRVYTDTGEAIASLSDLKLAVHAHGSGVASHTKITHADDAGEIYMILENTLSTHINFSDFEII